MKSLEKRLLRKVSRAIKDYRMIAEGDRVMVCLSGGKDSYTMLSMLQRLQARAPIDFSLIAVNLDQGQPGFPKHVLPEYLEATGVPYHIVEKDTYSIVVEKTPAGKTTCSLCSRLRRGILYSTASALGATKIALGHHRDDLIETLLLNLFYSGQLKSMPPWLRSDDGRHVVIRPLAYCPEAEIAAYAKRQDYPIIPCDLCGSQDNLQRKHVKRLIATLAERNGTVPGNMFAALRNVVPTHLLDLGLREHFGIRTPDDDSDVWDTTTETERAPSPGTRQVALNALRLAGTDERTG